MHERTLAVASRTARTSAFWSNLAWHAFSISCQWAAVPTAISPSVIDGSAVALSIAFGAGIRSIQWRQPAAILITCEFEALPEGLDRLIALPIKLEWCRRKVAN